MFSVWVVGDFSEHCLEFMLLEYEDISTLV